MNPSLLDIDKSSGRLRFAELLLRHRSSSPYLLYFDPPDDVKEAAVFPAFVCRDIIVETDHPFWRSSQGMGTGLWEFAFVSGARLLLQRALPSIRT